MIGKSAVFAVALAAAAWVSSSGTYAKSDPKPIHKRVVVEELKSRTIEARRHVVVPRHEVVVVRGNKKKIVPAIARKAGNPRA